MTSVGKNLCVGEKAEKTYLIENQLNKGRALESKALATFLGNVFIIKLSEMRWESIRVNKGRGNAAISIATGIPGNLFSRCNQYLVRCYTQSYRRGERCTIPSYKYFFTVLH